MQKIGVIMAGGGGTRFWPLSRRATPKQLLKLDGKEYMVCEAIDRLAPMADGVRIVTNGEQAEKIRAATNGRVAAKDVLCEPSAQGTAACIGYAAAKIVHEYGDAVMLVTPSDAYIRDEESFRAALVQAAEAAETSARPVTVGIQPTFPATGYGYIRRGKAWKGAHEVEAFVEKPDEERARAYLADGRYLWNSGMFVWKASAALERIAQAMPALGEGLRKIAASFGTEKEEETVKAVYPTLPNLSIDYGVMEKSSDILVVDGDFGWNDVGSWDMLGVLHAPDEAGNVTVGDAVLSDTKNSVIYSSGRTIAVVGMDDTVVVETEDCVMVCPRSRAQDVKKLVEELKKRDRKELL